jgi:trimethylguanosine synthase
VRVTEGTLRIGHIAQKSKQFYSMNPPSPPTPPSKEPTGQAGTSISSTGTNIIRSGRHSPHRNNNSNSNNDNNNNNKDVRGTNEHRQNRNLSHSPHRQNGSNHQYPSNTDSTTPGGGERGHHRDRKSQSPKRLQHQQQNKSSKSPPRNNRTHKSKSPTPPAGYSRRGGGRNNNNNNIKQPASAMTVVVNRCDLWDSAAHFQPEECHPPYTLHPGCHVNPYWFAPDSGPPHEVTTPPRDETSVVVARVPHHVELMHFPSPSHTECSDGTTHHKCDVIDNDTPNPYDSNLVHDKYWAQRRRLFSRFDRGIQLDSQGWYSVTPEIIADHVAERVSTLVSSPEFKQAGGNCGNNNKNADKGIIILDAFCGCGGNSIAFGKLPSDIVSKVICVDTDRSKLLMAAHNASLYDIPKEKLIFVECNSIFILKYCYKNGEFVLDQPTSVMPQYMPPPVMPTVHAGYQVGGLDMLPRHIDLAFFDPPWGGVDYELLGKNGYDLEKNMKIQFGPPPVDDGWGRECDGETGGGGGGVSDDFFDTFAAPKHHHMSKNARKKNFNKQTEGDFVTGKDLIQLAAEATRSRVVLYDLPRNTSKSSLGKCALEAGYRGNLKLEEHYLNGRLKTVTAYLGSDYSALINESVVIPSSTDNSVAGLSGDEA